MNLGEADNANVRTTSPVSTNMPTSDSTSVSMVTGYNETNKKSQKSTIPLPMN